MAPPLASLGSILAPFPAFPSPPGIKFIRESATTRPQDISSLPSILCAAILPVIPPLIPPTM